MSNYHEQESIPVPRKRLFVHADGRFVIQWEENRVQDLLSGRYSPYHEDDFGNAITDYELNQLQNTGVVAEYDEHLIYLHPDANTKATTSGRTYYLNTTLHKSRVDEINAAIQDADVADLYSVRIQEIFAIIRGPSGTAYQTFDEAERARENITARFPDLLKNTVVAFVEINHTP